MKKWKIGDLVAVNDLPDGQVYEIHETHKDNKFMRYLIYYVSGKMCGGGWLDVSAFKSPTKAQLTNYIKTIV